MNWHFKRLFSKIKSVCRTILRFFLIFSRCNKETLICRIDLCPGIYFRLKVITSWMEKVFLMQMLPPHINQNGSAKVELGRKPSIASANKECSTILSNRSLRTELSIENIFCNKTGGSCNKPIPEVEYVRQRFKFSRICSRLVDVRDNMIPYCYKSSWKWFSDICYKLSSLFFYIIFTCFVHGRELSKYLVHKIIFSSKCS